ncbi:hypothetical protein LINPERHAP1_LOCUS15896 [Linum perenne]
MMLEGHPSSPISPHRRRDSASAGNRHRPLPLLWNTIVGPPSLSGAPSVVPVHPTSTDVTTLNPPFNRRLSSQSPRPPFRSARPSPLAIDG